MSAGRCGLLQKFSRCVRQSPVREQRQVGLTDPIAEAIRFHSCHTPRKLQSGQQQSSTHINPWPGSGSVSVQTVYRSAATGAVVTSPAMQTALARCRTPLYASLAAAAGAQASIQHCPTAAISAVQRAHTRRVRLLQPPPCRALSCSHAPQTAATVAAPSPAKPAAAAPASASAPPARSASAVYAELRQKELQEVSHAAILQSGEVIRVC